MKKISVKLWMMLLLCSPGFAQQKPFSAGAVKLNSGVFKNAQDVDLAYILKLDPDKLLAPYLIDAGLPLKAERYGNWESSGLDGHIGGHYLSALAMMYASTGNPETKNRLDYMVNQLALCQTKNGNGYVGGIPQGKIFWERIRKADIDGSSFGLNNTWVPLYNIHKLFAGLYDAYHYTGNKEALTVLKGLSDWMIELFAGLSDEQLERVLRTEHGGLNEVFAQLYTVTQEKRYLDAAIRLTQKAFLNPLIEGKDQLTGLHANTQIPKVIGIEAVADLTNDKDWHKASLFFWDNVAHHRSVAFGGNSYREHFHELDRFDKMLETNQGPETCNSYNMLKLSKALYLKTGDTKYLDFYERTMFNHILSSQHPEKGGFVYFTPIRPNHYRVYSQPETSMWCCVGTGIENHARYGELIYSHEKDKLFVNLFVASELNWNGANISQTTGFPYENSTRLKIGKSGKFDINLRKPEWASNFAVKVNGKLTSFTEADGFLKLSRKWKSGDEVIYSFEPKLSMEFLPNDTRWAAFRYGPVVLARESSKNDLTGLFADDSRMGHETRGALYPLSSGHVFISDSKDLLKDIKAEGSLKFSIDSLTLKPFFDLHDARYQMYFQVLNKDEFKRFNADKDKENAFESSIIDRVNLGEQQPEVDHGYKGEKSNSGYDHGSFWRNTEGYISYRLVNKNTAGKTLQIAALDKITAENLTVEANGKVVSFNNENDRQITINISGEEVIDLVIKPAGRRPTPRLTRILVY